MTSPSPASRSSPARVNPPSAGTPARHNPEELFVAALAGCHLLWYLHLCAVNGVIVTAYTDAAEGEMQETPGGAGRFVRVTLRPTVELPAGSDTGLARRLHASAHAHCFLANSVNFPVECEPQFVGG